VDVVPLGIAVVGKGPGRVGGGPKEVRRVLDASRIILQIEVKAMCMLVNPWSSQSL